MELQMIETTEIETTEVAADDVRELNSLELALVGGGQGAVLLG